MRHATLQAIAERLAEVGIATFRYNLPLLGEWQRTRFSGRLHRDHPCGGRGGPPCRSRAAAAGGRPFLQRRTTLTAASEAPLDGVAGLVFFSFP